MYTCKNDLVITIGREFGSGGRGIGKKVAKELGIPFYDKELLAAAAKINKIDEEHLKQFDEKTGSIFFYTMAFNPYESKMVEPFDVMIHNILAHTIRTVASQGPCVIVGRRADKILSGEDFDVLSVFVTASLEKRILRVAQRDGLTEKESERKIIKADKSRKAFYNSYGEKYWGAANNYNLCIDSGDLGMDNSADMILQYLKLKGKITQKH